MNFFNTWAFGFAAIAPVIVLLYLLKLKRKPVPVSTLLFWQRVLQENRRSALFQKLRQWLSLLFHLLIFTLILLALTRPTLDRAVHEGSSTVLILDTRARMQALEPDGQTRFQKAATEAKSYAKQAGAFRQMALLSANAAPSAATPFTGDERTLRETLESLRPSDAGGNLQSAIRLARELLASRSGERRIVVVSDEPAPQEAGSSPIDIASVTVGAPQDNTAILRFATRAVPASPDTSEVLLELANFGVQRAAGNVELSYDGKLLDVQPFQLAPGERKLTVFPSVPHPSGAGSENGGRLTARIDAQDALPADNIAYAVLPIQAPRRILLVTKGNWFLEKLLEADSRVRFELLTPEAFQLSMASEFDAVIFDNALPSGYVFGSTPGNFLFIKQTPFAAGGEIEQPLITDVDARHPALQLVNLGNVAFSRAAGTALPARAPEGWRLEAPLRSFDHPLLIAGQREAGSPRQRIAAMAFDVADSDLPLRVAFPLLMANTIHWLAGEHVVDARTARAGETVTLDETEAVASEAQYDTAAPPPQGQAVRGSFLPLRNGFYRVQRPDASTWLAVNTFDEAQSNLRAVSAPAPAPRAPAMNALPRIAVMGWPLWQYLALAAGLLLGLEWLLFHRRRTE